LPGPNLLLMVRLGIRLTGTIGTDHKCCEQLVHGASKAPTQDGAIANDDTIQAQGPLPPIKGSFFAKAGREAGSSQPLELATIAHCAITMGLDGGLGPIRAQPTFPRDASSPSGGALPWVARGHPALSLGTRGSSALCQAEPMPGPAAQLPGSVPAAVPAPAPLGVPIALGSIEGPLPIRQAVPQLQIVQAKLSDRMPDHLGTGSSSAWLYGPGPRDERFRYTPARAGIRRGQIESGLHLT